MNAFTYPDNVVDFGSAAYAAQALRPMERITAPAIRLDDGRVFYAEPPPADQKGAMPPTYKKVEAEILLSGHTGEIHPDMRGFLTTEVRWVRPKHAERIARAVGQVPFLWDVKIGLQPVDLWP